MSYNTISFKHIILFLVLFILTVSVKGQEVKFTSKADTSSIMLGDQIKLKLELSAPRDYILNIPQQDDSLLNPFEVIANKDTLLKDMNPVKYQREYLVTAYDSGWHKVGPFSAQFQKPGDSVWTTIFTDSLMIFVNTPAVDTTKAFKDIKDVLGEPLTLEEILPYTIGILAVVLIIFLIIYYIKRRQKNKPFIKLPSRPKLPPYELAIQSLETLRVKRLWQNDQIKEYYTELTDILRNYIEGQFKINAVEMTSDEIMESYQEYRNDTQQLYLLRNVLHIADLVKFAKEKPLPSEHDKALQDTIEFVQTSYKMIMMNNGQTSDEALKQ